MSLKDPRVPIHPIPAVAIFVFHKRSGRESVPSAVCIIWPKESSGCRAAVEVGEAPEVRNYFIGAGLNSIGILTGDMKPSSGSAFVNFSSISSDSR